MWKLVEPSSALFQPLQRPLWSCYKCLIPSFDFYQERLEQTSSSLVIVKAVYGHPSNETLTQDVTNIVRDAIIELDDNYPTPLRILALTNGCFSPEQLFNHRFEDPAPGVMKVLRLELAHHMCSTPQSIKNSTYKVYAQGNSAKNSLTSSAHSRSRFYQHVNDDNLSFLSSFFLSSVKTGKSPRSEELAWSRPSSLIVNIPVSSVDAGTQEIGSGRYVNPDKENPQVSHAHAGKIERYPYHAAASSPSPNVVFRVSRQMCLHEHAYDWLNSKIVVPNATLSILLNEGLSNQIYTIASVALIASRTHRSLVFPFRLLARQMCERVRGPPLLRNDQPFHYLFDSHAFLSQVPCCIYDQACTCVLGVGVTAPPPVCDMKSGRGHAHPYCVRDLQKQVRHQPAPAESSVSEAEEKKEKKEKKEETEETTPFLQKMRTQRNLLFANMKNAKVLTAYQVCNESSEIETLWSSSAQHIVANNPTFCVKPSNQEDYNHMIDTMLSIRPNFLLQSIANKFENVLLDHALQTTGHRHFIALHVRQERDWFKWETYDPKNFSLRSFFTSIQPFLQTLPPTHSEQPSSSPSLDAPRVSRKVAVYVMSGEVHPQFWKEIRENTWLFSNKEDPNFFPLEVEWMRKDMFFTAVPELSQLGFEQLAVIDREIGLNAAFFVPNSDSSLSTNIVIERDALGKHSALFLKAHEAWWLIKDYGPGLFPYTGQHPRSKNAIKYDERVKLSAGP